MREAWAGPVEKGADAIRQGIEALPTPEFPEALGYAFLGCYILLAAVTVGRGHADHRAFAAPQSRAQFQGWPEPAHPLK